jgi:hypothetical protein
MTRDKVTSMTIKAARLMVLVAALSAVGACGGASAKQSILRTFGTSNMSPEETKCVSDALAKYSGSNQDKIRKAFDVDGLNPTEPMAIEFMNKHNECAAPSTRSALFDEIVQASPTLSELQRACVKSTLEGMSAAELQGGALGARLAEVCRT